MRPFTARNGIDLPRLHDELIEPVLHGLGSSGGTEPDLDPGSIHAGMFRQVVIDAGLALADVSVHNADVFNELGTRRVSAFVEHVRHEGVLLHIVPLPPDAEPLE